MEMIADVVARAWRVKATPGRLPLTRIVLDADWNHVCGAGIVCLRR